MRKDTIPTAWRSEYTTRLYQVLWFGLPGAGYVLIATRAACIYINAHMQGVFGPIYRGMGSSLDICCNHLADILQGPNLQCFINRVASHPERLQYIYFNTVLMLRAVERLRPYLSAYDYCSNGNHEDDEVTLERLSTILNIAHEVGRFDETVLFRGENANVSLDPDAL